MSWRSVRLIIYLSETTRKRSSIEEISEFNMGGAKLNNRRKKMRSSIEEIPEELLVKIISLLSFKDAVRSSIISCRWRHLWKHIPNLVIDSHNALSFENDLMLMISMRQRLKAGEQRVNGVSTKITEEFIYGANSILLDHRGILDSLAIKFFLNREHAIHLDGWISRAIASRVKKLVLNLRSPHKVRYNFPCHLLSRERCFLEFLELKFCSLESPIQEFEGFRNLTTLQLESVHVTDDVIQKLLPKCVAVKDLSFISCNQLLGLQFPASLCNLEHLEVSCCEKLMRVECYAPELSSFKYCGDEASLKIKVVEQAVIIVSPEDSSYMTDHLPQTIASAKKLKFYKIWAHDQVPITPNFQERFVHLKHLELLYRYTIKICEVIAFLDASPFLQTFAARVWGAAFDNESKKDTMQPKCPYNNIKSVTIHGFTGHNSQLELTSFFLANATQLEVMTIQSSTRYSDFGRELKVCPLQIEVENKMFYELLCRQAPQHVKLLVL